MCGGLRVAHGAASAVGSSRRKYTQADGLPSEIIIKVSLVGPPEALCCALSLIEVRITPTFAAYVAVW